MAHGSWVMAKNTLALVPQRPGPSANFVLVILKFQISSSTSGCPDWSKNKDSGRNVHDDGHPSTKSPNNLLKRCACFEAAPTQMSFIKSVGLDKKIMGIFATPPRIMDNSRNCNSSNTNKYFEGDPVF